MTACGATTRAGGQCGRPAGWGTEHVGFGKCKLHGGKSPSGNKHAEREQAHAAVVTYGLPREIDPHAALLEELHRTAGHVAWLGQIIASGKMAVEQSPTRKARTVKLDQDVFGGGQQPSVWVELYHRERKHFADVAKTCIAVGIEERRVQIAEQQGQLLAEVIRGVLTDLGVVGRPEVPAVVRKHLTLVAGA
jgi:hypothetical protein